MLNYIYKVHSDVNENQFYDEFETRQEAIEYADQYRDQATWVEQVEYEVNDFGEGEPTGFKEIVYSTVEPEVTESEDSIETEAELDAELDADYEALVAEDETVTEAMKVKDNKLVIGDEEMVDEEKALKAAEPVTDEKTVKAAIGARVKSAEKKTQAAVKDMDPKIKVDTVCKNNKVILHSEDDVKDLKENLVEAVSKQSELKDLLSLLTNEQLVDFNNAHWAETTAYENGKFNLYDHNADTPYNSMSRDEFEDLIIKTIDTTEPRDLDYDKLREELEENEDEVECQVCFNLVPKEEAIKTDGGYYICKQCWEENSLDEALSSKAAKVGDTIRIIHLKDEGPEYDGREGTIDFIDDIGQLHGTWGGLAVIPEADDFEIIARSGNLHEDFDPAMPELSSNTDAVAILSALVEDEWEAITGYTDAAAKLEKLDLDPKTKNSMLAVLAHISKEESMHVGQLSELLKLFDATIETKEDEGKEEALAELAEHESPTEEIEIDTDEDVEVEEVESSEE